MLRGFPRKRQRSLFCLIALVVVFALPQTVLSASLKSSFPRVAGLQLGGPYQDPEYREKMSEFDIVVFGMWSGFSKPDTVSGKQLSFRDVILDVKRRAIANGNSDIVLGKYTIFNESPDTINDAATRDKYEKLSSEKGPGYAGKNDWWARNSSGQNTSSWAGTWHTNVTDFVQRDANGDTFTEWNIERDYKIFFRDNPELEIWYFDNWFYKPRVRADWDGDGVNDSPDDENVRAYFRRGYERAINRARELAPDRLLVGNTDGNGGRGAGEGLLREREYTGKINAHYQGIMGHSWSPETWASWQMAMDGYHLLFETTSKEKLVIFDVRGAQDDYQFFRYSFGSCLLNDGYYTYMATRGEYGVVPYFDEYDVAGTKSRDWLGVALEAPQKQPWKDGVYRRRFENGMVLVNPRGNGQRTIEIEPGYSFIRGNQDPTVNTGQPANRVTLRDRDAIVLISDNPQAVPDRKRPRPPVLQ